jgi:hypothetical protein
MNTIRRLPFAGPQRAAALLLVLVLLAFGCSEETAQPEEPQDNGIISGAVHLTGTLRNEAGDSLGQRTITDASGLQVFLASDSTLVDSTTTASGAFSFDDVEPGIYQVVSWVVPSGIAVTAEFAVGTSAIVLSAPMTLNPGVFVRSEPIPRASRLGAETAVTDTVTGIGQGVPDLRYAFWVSPNPWSPTITARLVLRMPIVSSTIIEIRRLSGEGLRLLVSDSLEAGSYSLAWDGRDSDGNLVIGATFATLEADSVEGWELLFRE